MILRRYIALGLLLTITRVLVPDGVLLVLHPHRHTEREVAHEGRGLKAVFTAKHTHCPSQHLFNAPALPAAECTFGVVVPGRFAQPQSEEVASRWPHGLVQTLRLRGPPALA